MKLFIFIICIQLVYSWKVKFLTPDDNGDSDRLNLKMQETFELPIEIAETDTIKSPTYKFMAKTDKPEIADTNSIILSENIPPSSNWIGNISISGNLLGKANLYLQLVLPTNITEDSNEKLSVIVTRKERVIDHVFTGSVILLVSLLNINFGAAIDLSKMRGILTRPIGPILGFVGQFIVMPLVSFGLGFAVFSSSPELHLGLFFTGVSPGGGASNMWSVILGGNIDLSIIMTSISTLACFGMMPLWIFTLGKVIFDRAELRVPYSRIASFTVALLVPLAIGILIQYYLPRVRRVLVRLLKPISMLLILFIIIFAIVTNLYLFELFSWRIIVAGLGLPWIGYILSLLGAKACKQNSADSLTIAIETGIVNTGISIALLKFCLDQPAADLTTVIPVSVAIFTPIPLLVLYVYQKCQRNPNGERSKILATEAKENNFSD
ncbi:hypothetical protein ACFFRR_008180 [Megaselia abdita]